MTSQACSLEALTPARALEQFAGAQYLVDAAGAVILASPGAQLAEARRALADVCETLDRSYVGATWASLFLRRRWVRRFKVRLWAEHEYDDEGGTYLSYYNSVSDVLLEPSQAVPEELCTEGQPDHELLEGDLWAEISAFDGDAFQCLGLTVAGAELTRVMRRDHLDGLLSQGDVKGQDAFDALFAGDARAVSELP